MLNTPKLRLSVCPLLTAVFLLLPATARAADPTPKLITLGDSITKGVRPGVTAEQTFTARLKVLAKQQGVEIDAVNLGIGGEQTAQALVRLERDVLSAKPQIVAIMYGTNDSYVDRGKQDSRLTEEQYRDNLQELVKRLRKAGVQPILMTEPRWGEKAVKNGAGEHPNVRLERYVAICRETGRELKVPLVDHYALWSKHQSEGTDIGTWTTDQCHPNPRGHEVMAETALPVVLETLKGKK